MVTKKKEDTKKPEIAKKPAIDTSRFSALLEEKHEAPAFPEPEKVTLQNHQIVCFGPSRDDSRQEKKKILVSLNLKTIELLKNHTNGSTSVCIEKLVEYAIEDLLKRNISIK